MKKRQVGNSDLYVSELGLGCMSLGTDQKKAQELIETALDEGINYFDTADLYDFGENEQIVGQALKHVKNRISGCIHYKCTSLHMFFPKFNKNFRSACRFIANHLSASA